MNSNTRELLRKQTETYFNGNHLDELGNKYVVWIDIMGVRDKLRKDQKLPAIFRGELLTEVYRYVDSDKVEEVFTVGDGVVIMSNDESYLLEFVSGLLNHYATFNLERWGDWEMNYHRFLRVGFGSGRVYKIDVEDFEEDADDGSPFPSEFPNTPFGPGPIEAFSAEGGAPLSIQYSDGTSEKWWSKGVGQLSDHQRKRLVQLIAEYFDWHDSRGRYNYDPYSDESGHLEYVKEYFETASLNVDHEAFD